FCHHERSEGSAPPVPLQCSFTQVFLLSHPTRIVRGREPYSGLRFICKNSLDTLLYFYHYRNMQSGIASKSVEEVTKFADMFSAMGTEARLRIMQLLLS